MIINSLTLGFTISFIQYVTIHTSALIIRNSSRQSDMSSLKFGGGAL